MIGQLFDLRSMSWQVADVYLERGEQWASLTCLDKPMKPWNVPQTFLELMSSRRNETCVAARREGDKRVWGRLD